MVAVKGDRSRERVVGAYSCGDERRMEAYMKRWVLLSSLPLVIAISATALAQGNRTQAVPHDIGGSLKGTITFVELPFTEDFPFPYNVGSLGVTSGRLVGLGDSNAFTFHHPAPPPSSTEPSTVEDGRFFIVAANGDRIQGTYRGTTEPGTEPGQLVGRADWVITAGTGRFANATGTIHATAYVTVAGFDVFEWPLTWVLEGTITY